MSESVCEQSEEQDELAAGERALCEFADSVVRRGLGGPAVVMLDSLRPLNFIGSQMMHGLSPMVSIFFESRNWDAIAGIMEERGSVDRLIKIIERREQEQSQANS